MPLWSAPTRMASATTTVPGSAPSFDRITCPGDVLEPDTTLCRTGSGDLCDPDEYCTGTDIDCPGEFVEPGGTVCSPSLGFCDPAELCTGTAGDACPGEYERKRRNAETEDQRAAAHGVLSLWRLSQRAAPGVATGELGAGHPVLLESSDESGQVVACRIG